jgi:hypothetical protein
MGHEEVGGGAQGGVRGDAGITVRAAALHADDEMLKARGLAHCLGGVVGHLAQDRHALFDGAAGAAGLLDGHVAERLGAAQAAAAHEVGHLHDLAAQAHEKDAGEVGVAGIALEGAEQRLVAFVLSAHAAAGAVDDGDDAVDGGIAAEPRLALAGLGDEAAPRSRAVHGGEDAQVVAGADLAVGTAVAQEVPRLGDGAAGGGGRCRRRSRCRARPCRGCGCGRARPAGWAAWRAPMIWP